MKKLGMLMAPLAIAGLLALAACGKAPATGQTSTSTSTGGGGGCPASQTIGLGVSTFDNNGGCVTVTKGQPVSFADTTSGGGVHIICTGPSSGAYASSCSTDPNAPSDLQGNGFQINGGQTKQITFNNAGTYNVICTVHPNMQIKVVVQ